MTQQQNEKGQYRCSCGKTFATQNELRQHDSEQHRPKQEQKTPHEEKTRTAANQGRNE